MMLIKASVLAALSLGSASDYEPWCATDGLPKGIGAVVCDAIESQAKEIFAGTLDGNFTLLIGHKERGRLVEAKWGINSTSVQVIASASKWLSAAAILKWLDSSNVSLSQSVHEYVPWWSDRLPDPRAGVTLQHVLSQTDGFGETLTTNFTEDGPTIYSKDYANLATPQKIFTAVPIENYTKNMTGFEAHPSPYVWGTTPVQDLPKPGTVFYYEETHWRLAESVIAAASKRDLNDITADLAKSFKMENSKLENIPQLGGPEWVSTAEDLEKFLQHVVRRDFLKPETQKEFESDHTNSATWYGFRMRPDWGYALGSWSHCPGGSCKLFSSIGIFGTLPFVDYESGLYYALVRPAGLDPKRGVFLDRSVAFLERTYPAIREALKPVIEEGMVPISI
jgi:CubicO group peptidase (beta-lactamase class C family)